MGMRGEKGCVHVAMSRNLARRLDRLEEQMMPLNARKVWHVITINSDGTRAPSVLFVEWPSNSAMDRSQGPRCGSMTRTAASAHSI